MTRCSICQRELTLANCNNSWTLKHGNNASPVNDGRCCDVCNARVVIPARWHLAMQHSEEGLDV